MKVDRIKPLAANIGIFGVGHWKYWQQYEGLEQELLGYIDDFDTMVKANGVNTTNFGMADDAETGYEIMKKLKAADLDLIFCDMVTYATSSTAKCNPC